MKKTHMVQIAVALTLAAGLALYFLGGSTDGGIFSRNAGVLTFVSTGVTLDFDENSGALFGPAGGNGFFFATRDGIRYMTDDGRTPMAEVHTMQSPVLYVEGQVAGVTEHMGYKTYVYSTQRLMYSKDFANPIVNFAINKMGYSCVVTKNGDTYECFVYNDKGSLLIRFIESNLNVVSVAISQDGRILALGRIDPNGAQLNSILSFLYLDSREGAPYTDSIFGAIFGENVPELNNQIFGIIRFMNGNNLVVVTGKTIFCVSEAQPSKAKWIIELDNELEALHFSESHIVTSAGRGILNRVASPAGRVMLINLDGTVMWEHDAGYARQNAISLYVNELGVIIGDGKLFTAIDLKGQKLWEQNAQYNAKGAAFLDAADNILLYTDSEATVLKRVRIRSGEQPDTIN